MKSPFLFLVNHMDVQKMNSKDYIQNRKFIYSIIVSMLIILFEVSYSTDVFREITGNYRPLFGIISFLLLPAAPIIYGWVTKDKVGAIVVGVLPISSILLYGNFILGNVYSVSNILKVIAYAGVFTILGGMAGYLASKRRMRDILVAIGLGVVWILVYLSGLD